jgi:hypothetical protein
MRYDFDEYQPTESPRKRCRRWANSFPDCIEGCGRLRAFQAALVGAVQTGTNRIGSLPKCFKVSGENR